MPADAGHVGFTGLSSCKKLDFESGKHSLDLVPRVLEIDCSGVYIHKDGPSQDEVESLEKMNWIEDRVLKPNLSGDSYGDFCCLVGIISTKHFESREKLDALYAREYGRSKPVKEIKRISLERALQFLTVRISCNMAYYLSHHDLMEKDLGRKLNNLHVNKKRAMKNFESELLNNQALMIFGKESSDDDDQRKVSKSLKKSKRRKMNKRRKSSIVLRDFHLLYSDGNDKIATARRGDHYVLFYYVMS